MACTGKIDSIAKSRELLPSMLLGLDGLFYGEPSGCEKRMLRELVISFGIVAICVVIHTTGMIILAERLLNRRVTIERQMGVMYFTFLLILVFANIILLHLSETAIWAAFYHWRGLFPDYETSLYFSMGSYTTIGYGDIVLPQRWRLLGGIEGISGVLLCGLSAAFIFVIVSWLFQLRMRQHEKS